MAIAKNPFIQDSVEPKTRAWEEFYRNRWQYDKVVRSTHGVNCTGGCSWDIHVKDGIVTWEMQALDYPSLCAVHASRATSRAVASAASPTPGISTARCA